MRITRAMLSGMAAIGVAACVRPAPPPPTYAAYYPPPPPPAYYYPPLPPAAYYYPPRPQAYASPPAQFAPGAPTAWPADPAAAAAAAAAVFAQAAGAAARAPAPAPTGAPAAAPGSGAVYDPDPDGRPTAILRDDAPNMRYAALDTATCEAELVRRGVPFARGEATQGVMAPERLRGPLHGVTISTGASQAVRDKSTMEIFDCRLVLALDDFAAMASPRGITQMLHISAYRPKSANGCTDKYPGLQHCAALAVDIAQFRLSNGTVWNVQKDFQGQIGAATCGPTAKAPGPSAASQGLHALVCDAAAQGIFNVMLTPNYNAEHFNHFHVEITPNANWMLIH
jgi:hypothetical protein